MGNMSHCRFQNTDNDLDDCLDNIEDNDLSEEEEKARKNLINTCIEIAVGHGHLVDKDVSEN